MMPTLSSLVAPEVVVMTTPGATSDVKVCVMMISLSSLVASEVVIMTTSDATSDDKVGIITPLGFIPVPFVSRYFTCMSGPGRAWPQRSGGICYPFIVLHKIFMTLPRYFPQMTSNPLYLDNAVQICVITEMLKLFRWLFDHLSQHWKLI